jgi:hypothetical protein
VWAVCSDHTAGASKGASGGAHHGWSLLLLQLLLVFASDEPFYGAASVIEDSWANDLSL